MQLQLPQIEVKNRITQPRSFLNSFDGRAFSTCHKPHCQLQLDFPYFCLLLLPFHLLAFLIATARRCSQFDAADFAFPLPFVNILSFIAVASLLFVMPSQLLNCTICPKKPRFSDVSHLLTHVGSKGHLAHLHRLQVKSHQELDAGHTLAIYNQWFQEHGVAGLLSERMQQKEHKQADKKAANQARLGTANLSGKSRGRKSTATTQRPPAISAYEPQPPQLKTSPSEEDFGDLDHTPVRAPRLVVFNPAPDRS